MMASTRMPLLLLLAFMASAQEEKTREIAFSEREIFHEIVEAFSAEVGFTPDTPNWAPSLTYADGTAVVLGDAELSDKEEAWPITLKLTKTSSEPDVASEDEEKLEEKRKEEARLQKEKDEEKARLEAEEQQRKEEEAKRQAEEARLAEETAEKKRQEELKAQKEAEEKAAEEARIKAERELAEKLAEEARIEAEKDAQKKAEAERLAKAAEDAAEKERIAKAEAEAAEKERIAKEEARIKAEEDARREEEERARAERAREEAEQKKEASLKRLKWRWADNIVMGSHWPRGPWEDKWNEPATRAELVTEMEDKVLNSPVNVKVANQYESRRVEFAEFDFPKNKRSFKNIADSIEWLKLKLNIEDEKDEKGEL